MGQANDSVLVTPGTGATIATQLAGAKEHQVNMLARPDGHLLGSEPLYFWNVPTAVHVAAASTLFVDVFNAHASLVVRVLSIKPVVNLETVVTGVGFEWQLLRTTAVGTGGTAIAGWLADTSDTALDAAITCRSKATGGATASTSLIWLHTNSEETLAGNQLAGGGFDLDFIPSLLRESRKGIVLRPGQGLRINQETNSAAGNTGFLIGFTVDS